MTLVTAICVAVTAAVSIYLLLSRELKGIAMGTFLIGHAANLSILAMSGEPVYTNEQGETTLKLPPILGYGEDPANPLATMVDPLPQALILTAIVISFGVMGFLLALIVATGRVTGSLDLDEFDDDPKGLHPEDAEHIEQNDSEAASS
ncbi:sodium:proton antiporter [Mucisphaera calidilacus]|uniref:Na(+)/H(+) antiporter subunit C1 n=1 Tax=Mucisphaera calidilacus TaxID=2527982 RepID=A0A518BX58_9BACT|nr:sodium:proton antiporter [Mucisphaera calidilacus]QDU71570.1 Na(+)/H(+) antiporter subunit C1 [Mucisphaera calidilacus]